MKGTTPNYALDFEKELGGFDAPAVQRIMHDNCVELLGAAP